MVRSNEVPYEVDGEGFWWRPAKLQVDARAKIAIADPRYRQQR